MFSLITASNILLRTLIIHFFRLKVKALLYACKMQLKNAATVHVTPSESVQFDHSPSTAGGSSFCSSHCTCKSGDILTRELICARSESFPLMSRRAPGEGRPGGFM